MFWLYPMEVLMSLRKLVLVFILAASIWTSTHAGAAVVSHVMFSDQTYADADWTIVNQFGLVSAGQQPAGGNPGSYRQVVLSVGQNVPFVGQINRNFVYTPSSQGAVTGITYNVDLETTNAEGATYFALISQNNNLYIETTHTGNATPNTWFNENIVLTLADFSLLKVSPTNALLIDRNSHPDFSSAGSAIRFGYEVTAGGGGFFTSITGIDNDPIILTVTPAAVPEHSILAIVIFGTAIGVLRLARLRADARAILC